ncbi:EutN/CcmL family microcompartment protein [Streptococcus pluranimalium]|uniref:Carbon dioxide concentrating mechanism protein CcmL n=1 Tax=Streptococcus pluranimalium TaxID=82348 RepID=A0A345VM80_9STRE|nr:EutN/CcmL family microcompartment protein [Streptococcus pluranimalium]AXJ13832.1 Carbon dioxide concentrating mechanism protein CcmL [Streptococcus pluranimalium]
MIIGKVVGNLWSTKKDDKLNGKRFLMIRKLDAKDSLSEDLFVAADKVGAGIGETVLVTTGSNSRFTYDDDYLPIDLAIVGIVDSYDLTEI